MQKYFIMTAVFLLVICFLSGCSLPFINSSEMAANKDDKTAASNAEEGAKTDGAVIITGEEDSRIKSLINDYFLCLYSEPVQDYYIYASTGKLPEKIKDFISKDTISMAEGNKEIGIHFPRFIETNGLVCVEYRIETDRTSNDKENPVIKADFVGEYGKSLLYYTKVNLYAKCVNMDNFENLFTLNEADNTWTKIDKSPIEDRMTDTIRIQVRYDVQVKKEDGNYKIEAVKEAVTTNDAKTRLLIYNNDFVQRLSYLDCSKSEDGKRFKNEEDGKVYTEEQTIITEFFGILKNRLNNANMKLMQTAWEKSAEDFSSFLDKLSEGGESNQAGKGDSNAKKLSDLINIKADYKTQFDFCSFPLQLNMEKFKGDFTEMEILPHPGYTKNRKIYIVTFKAPVMLVNGTVEGRECIYRYDYYVTFSKVNDRFKISGIRLNEFGRESGGKA